MYLKGKRKNYPTYTKWLITWSLNPISGKINASTDIGEILLDRCKLISIPWKKKRTFDNDLFANNNMMVMLECCNDNNNKNMVKI